MAMQKEVSQYAAVQKEGNGLDKVVEDAKYYMRRYGVSPNLLIIPPQLALYMSLAPEEKISYKEGGPAALANFESGVQGFTARAFRGCGVVTSDPFEVSDDTEAVQMLQRFSQIGEHYIMSVPEGVADGAVPNVADVLIYDEERDVHVKISFKAALAATGVAELIKKEDVVIGKKDDGSDYKLSDWNKDAGSLANGTVNAATKKIAICLARPFIEHAMLSAVLTVSGQDTGATIFGPSDMQISANTSVKTIEGHYTGHFKSVVTKPQNVYVLRDIMANGYRAGCNTKFFAPDGEFDTMRQNIQARLNFENLDADDVQPSLLAFPMMMKQVEEIQNEITVTTRLLPWDVNGAPGARHKSFPGGPEMYKLYNGAMQLEQIHFGEDLRASENMEYMTQGSSNNALCFTGPHRKYDPITKAYTALVPGMGHWGADARPGDARWRRGEAVSMMSAREQMLSYEQLQYIPQPRI